MAGTIQVSSRPAAGGQPGGARTVSGRAKAAILFDGIQRRQAAGGQALAPGGPWNRPAMVVGCQPRGAAG